MTRIELPPSWAPMPHALIVDHRVSDPAVRLYGLIYKCGWEHRDIADMADLASLWPTPPGERPPSERSFYRWLEQLAAAGWATYHRRPGQKGLGDRLQLHPEPLAMLAEISAEPLTPASEDSPAGAQPLTPESEPLTPESEDRPTSDTRVRASDTRVRGLKKIAHQDAAREAPQILRQILDSDLPPPEQNEPAAPAGGGGDASAETIAILLAAEVITAHTYGDIPPPIARAAVEQARKHPQAATKLGALTAGLLNRWRSRTWAPPPSQEHDHAPVSTRRRPRAAAAERPAGSGPPPGVRTPTPADLEAWGLGPARPAAPDG